MSRKHENFSYFYGCRTAPEQWYFYYNGNYIPLNDEIRNRLAILCISGKRKEAEDELKRLLRKEEKETYDYVTYGFYGKNSNNFYFSRQLKAHDNNINEKLSVYKEFKKYIEERDGYLHPFIITTGHITPNGNEKLKVDKGILIDLDRKIRIRLTEDTENRLFTI